MALPARKAVVRAFGDRGLRLEARALAMLTSHVEQAAAKAASKGMLNVADGVEGFDVNDSSSAAAAAAAAAADAALAKLLDAYEPGETAAHLLIVGKGGAVLSLHRMLLFSLLRSLSPFFSRLTSRPRRTKTHKKATPPASPPRRPRASSPPPRARTRRR